MKVSYIEENSNIINECKEKINVGAYLYSILKDIPGIKYIEEITKEEVILAYSIYEVYPTVRITKEISVDLVCSVVGEIEDALDAEATMKIDSNEDRIYYLFYDKEGHYKLQLIVGHPRCRFIVDKEIVNHYESKSYERRVICD